MYEDPKYLQLLRASSRAIAQATGAGKLSAAIVGYLSDEGVRIMFETENQLHAEYVAASEALLAYMAAYEAAHPPEPPIDIVAVAAEAHTAAAQAYEAEPTFVNSQRLNRAFRTWAEIKYLQDPLYEAVTRFTLINL